MHRPGREEVSNTGDRAVISSQGVWIQFTGSCLLWSPDDGRGESGDHWRGDVKWQHSSCSMFALQIIVIWENNSNVKLRWRRSQLYFGQPDQWRRWVVIFHFTISKEISVSIKLLNGVFQDLQWNSVIVIYFGRQCPHLISEWKGEFLLFMILINRAWK